MNSDIENAANQIPLGAPANSTSMRKGENLEEDTATGCSGKLFVGSLAAAESIQFLSHHNITHVLTVAKNLPVKIPNRANDGGGERASTSTSTGNIQHLVVECLDHPMANILEVLDECLTFVRDGLREAQDGGNSYGNVLVHCASGVSRSVTVCAAYLMKYYGWEWSEAIKHISKTRKYANPNLGFRRQLQILQNCNGDIDAALEAYTEYNVDVISDTIRQRGVVNELHAEVDALEDALAKLRSITTTQHSQNANRQEEGTGQELKLEDIARIKSALCILQTELDTCLPTDSEGLVDPPAKMIRKSAVTKVQRLLDSIPI